MIWLCLFVYVFVVLFWYGVLFVLFCLCCVSCCCVYFSYVWFVFILLFLLYERTLLEPPRAQREVAEKIG